MPDCGPFGIAPIHVDDVVAYLRAVLDVDLPVSTIYEIGGPDRLSYLDLMNLSREEHGLTVVRTGARSSRSSTLWQRALGASSPSS